MKINYDFFPGVEIKIENFENIPRDQSVFFALNHTDIFTAWPFQYGLIKKNLNRFTSTWIKAKYYKYWPAQKILDFCNGIPAPSKGYYILGEAKKNLNKILSQEEYREIKLASEEDLNHPIAKLYDRSMKAFTEKNREALFEKKNHVIVFPQGTRSKRLLPARAGILKMAASLGVPILPVGANGVDQVYPSASPWGKSGEITYRIGQPYGLSKAALKNKAFFEEQSRDLTQKINELLDPMYQLELGGEIKGWSAKRLL